MTRHYLLISPYFPPMGVVGVKRALNLVRHLPQLGWQPVVLASPPLTERRDDDLATAVPKNTPVSYGYTGRLHRLLASKPMISHGAAGAHSVSRPLLGFDRQYFTPFDRFIVDTPTAVIEGLRLIRRYDARAIQVSADPWSGLLVGDILARLTGLPLIPDLRDPWSAHTGKMALRPPPSRALLRAIEAHVFERAAAVVLNTEACRDRYIEIYRDRVPEARFQTIRNAFDETLFRPYPVGEERIPTLLYFGRFRVLMDPDPLLRGFRRLIDRHGLRPDQVRYRFVGGLRPRDQALAIELHLADYIDEAPPIPYRDALSVLASAHLLTTVVPPDYELQIPAKIYDYMAARRPVLAVSANPEVDRILTDSGAGRAVPFGNEDAIAVAMSAALEEPRPKPEGSYSNALERFSARAQARSFADLLEQVTA